jgi:hypothetical protein
MEYHIDAMDGQEYLYIYFYNKILLEKMERKVTIRKLLIIAGIFVLIGILGGFVYGIFFSGNQMLAELGGFLHYAALGLIIVLGMKLFPQYFMIPLTQEMKEDEIGESDQKDEKQ